MKTGLVVEGGGMRGIYASGVLDAFLKNGISFDYAVGVSAGGANTASFLAGQFKRTYRFFHEYGSEKDFLGLHSYLKTGQYFGLNYMYDTVSSITGKDPLDISAIYRSPTYMELVATDARTARAHYFTKDDMRPGNLDVLKATCCIPVINKPIIIDTVPYFDGGVADPLPIQRAFDSGCDIAVVILSSRWPKEVKKKKKSLLYHHELKQYPKLLKQVYKSDQLRDLECRLAFEYSRMGKAIVIMPEDDSSMSTLTRDKAKLEAFYWQGYSQAMSMMDLLKEKLQCEPEE